MWKLQEPILVVASWKVVIRAKNRSKIRCKHASSAIKPGFHMIATITTIAGAGKNVQQSIWSYGNNTLAIVAITAFHNDRWRVVSIWSQRLPNVFFRARNNRTDHMETSLKRLSGKQLTFFSGRFPGMEDRKLQYSSSFPYPFNFGSRPFSRWLPPVC